MKKYKHLLLISLLMAAALFACSSNTNSNPTDAGETEPVAQGNSVSSPAPESSAFSQPTTAPDRMEAEETEPAVQESDAPSSEPESPEPSQPATDPPSSAPSADPSIYLSGGEPPLDERSLTLAVPDFLTSEQQTLYLHAERLCRLLCGGDTEEIDYFDADHGSHESSGETFEHGGYTYVVSNGRYRMWDDFINTVYSLFTDEFWKTINKNDRYMEYNGNLAYVAMARGSGYSLNEYFPDEFRLVSKSETEIRFVLIGHYTPFWSTAEMSEGEAQEYRKNTCEYTIEFPITLVLTEDGWRFAEFHSSLADEQ